MSPLRDKFRDRQLHLARYRRLSILFAEDETTGRRCAVVLEMERRIEAEADANADHRVVDKAALLAEISTFIPRARGGMLFASQLLRPFRFSAGDLRERARLCRAEAAASEAMAMRSAPSSRALQLAILGETRRTQ